MSARLYKSSALPNESPAAVSLKGAQGEVLPIATLENGTMKFTYIYLKYATEMNALAISLIDRAESAGTIRFRFDMEWNYKHSKTTPNKELCDMIQVAVPPETGGQEGIVYLFHVCLLMQGDPTKFPSSLRALLACKCIIFVGCGIKGDATRLLNQFDITMSIEDSIDVAYKLGIFKTRVGSLNDLAQYLTGLQIDGKDTLRLGPWDRAVGLGCTKEMLIYAAIDAKCSFLIDLAASAMYNTCVEKNITSVPDGSDIKLVLWDRSCNNTVAFATVSKEVAILIFLPTENQIPTTVQVSVYEVKRGSYRLPVGAMNVGEHTLVTLTDCREIFLGNPFTICWKTKDSSLLCTPPFKLTTETGVHCVPEGYADGVKNDPFHALQLLVATVPKESEIYGKNLSAYRDAMSKPYEQDVDNI